MRVLLFSLLLAAGIGCRAPAPRQTSPPSVAAKLHLRLDNLGPDGLRGPESGRVAVAYEFCVPADAAICAEVKRIDPTVQISFGSRGRIGCEVGQALCLGSTHQPHWRQVLEQLAALDYVKEIRECYFE